MIGCWGCRCASDLFWEGLENLLEILDHGNFYGPLRAEVEVHSEIIVHIPPSDRDTIPVLLPNKQQKLGSPYKRPLSHPRATLRSFENR